MPNPLEYRDGRAARSVTTGAGGPTITVSANQPFSIDTTNNLQSIIRVEVDRSPVNLHNVEALNAEKKPFDRVYTPGGDYVGPIRLSPVEDDGYRVRHVKPENVPATLEALGLPKDLKADYIQIGYDAHTKAARIDIIMAEGVTAGSENVDKVLGALKNLKAAGKSVFSAATSAAIEAHVSVPAAASITEAAGRVGRTTLRAIAPLAAVQEVIGYTANASEAEEKLTSMIGKDGVPKLSKEAIAEYGAIVATSRVEQGVTFEISQAYGFSKFMDWGKKHNIPVEALEKLNPTNKTREQIEEALNIRGGGIAQTSTPEVVLAQTPDARQQGGRNLS